MCHSKLLTYHKAIKFKDTFCLDRFFTFIIKQNNILNLCLILNKNLKFIKFLNKL